MSENADIFTAQYEIHLVFTEKGKLSFHFILNGKLQKAQPNFSPGCFAFILTPSVCLKGITFHCRKYQFY